MVKESARPFMGRVPETTGAVAPIKLLAQLTWPSFFIPNIFGQHLVEQFFVGPVLFLLFLAGAFFGERRERWTDSG